MSYDMQLAVRKLLKMGLYTGEVSKKLRISKTMVCYYNHHDYLKPCKVKCFFCKNIFLKKYSGTALRDKCSSFKKFKGRERIREFVRIRDGHKCMLCKNKWDSSMRKFDIHHLNGKCGKMSRSYDKIESINGLITLCHECHMNLKEVKTRMINKSLPRKI